MSERDAIVNGRATTGPRRRRTMQSNLTQANEMLRIAHDLGDPDADAWAARMLACAHATDLGSGQGPLFVANRMAIAHGRWPAASELRALAHAAHMTSVGNTSAAPLRDDAAARSAFNRPTHWVATADGRLAPDASTLRNEAARAWSAATQRFGSDLAMTMFDANVRGGTVAVIAAMDAAGSRQALTVRDIAELQYVAFTSGSPSTLGVNALDAPTLHDAAHSAAGYGVSVHQEIHGDDFSEALINDLFGIEPEIVINRGAPLDQQPSVALQLSQLIDVRFANVSIDSLLQEIEPSFFSPTSTGPQLSHGWGQSPSEDAHRAEQILDANGLLAHLEPAGRRAVLALIYGAQRPHTFEAIATRLAQSGDRQQFARDVDAWLDDVADCLRAASSGSLMSRDEFGNHAARAVAFGLLLDRTAPGSLVMGPLDTGLGDADLPMALRQLDLRTTYPPVLREVQRALGPKR
jgi:hypothetical protein